MFQVYKVHFIACCFVNPKSIVLNQTDPTKKLTDPRVNTTHRITYLFVFLFGAVLVGLFITSFYFSDPKDPENKIAEQWMEIFKSAFVILGTVLTTIIGHYYGSKGKQEADQKAQNAEQLAEMAREEARNKEIQLENVLNSSLESKDDPIEPAGTEAPTTRTVFDESMVAPTPAATGGPINEPITPPPGAGGTSSSGTSSTDGTTEDPTNTP